MTPRQAASVRRILRERHPVAPAWMTPEWVVRNMPVTSTDIAQRVEQRCDQIQVLSAVARRALHELMGRA